MLETVEFLITHLIIPVTCVISIADTIVDLHVRRKYRMTERNDEKQEHDND